MKPWLILFVLATCSVVAAQTAPERRMISRLKTTPVARIEPGLPNQPFHIWLMALLHQSQVNYEVDDCGERTGTPQDAGKSLPVCVHVSALVEPVRKLDLTFVVGTSIASTGGHTVEKPGKIQLMYGALGPANPMSKQPTRAVRKLSDLEKLLNPTVALKLAWNGK
jgi:hypothetical protein